MAENIGTAEIRILADGSGLDRSIEREVESHGPAFKKAGRHMGDEFSDGFFDEFNKAAANVAKRQPMNLKTLTKAFEDLAKARDKNVDVMVEEEKVAKRLNKQMGLTELWLRHVRSELPKLSAQWNDNRRASSELADVMGQAFGRGSRNDFLNFVGVMVRGITKLSTAFTDLISTALSFAKVGGGGSAGIGGTFSKIIGSAGGVVGAVAAVTFAFGLMTAAASGLVGILTALVSVLAFGLVGAAGAAVGALAPLTFGIGALVLALTHLSDAQKNKLEPVGDAFHDLGDAAAESFGPALTRNVDRFVNILEGMEPVVRDVGREMGTVLDDFMDDLESPAWQRFSDRFSRFLPNAVESLGTSMRQFTGGMAGVFEALIPLTRRFLGWLEDITGEFQEWAQSAEGQRELRNFFEKAGDSAAALGDFLGAAAEALGSLLSAGNETGISILDRMTDALQRFADWMQTDEGKKALEDWFEAAEDLAIELGGLAEDIIELFDELDSPENREAVQDMVDLFGDLADTFRDVSDAMEPIVGPFLQLIGAFTKFNEEVEDLTGQNFLSIFNPLIVAFDTLPRLIGKIDFAGIGRSIIDGITRPFTRAFEQIRDIKLPKFDFKDVLKFPPISYIASQFRNAASAVGKAIGKFDVKDIFKFPPISYITSQFRNAASAVGKAIGKFNLKDIFEFPGVSYVTGKFRDWAGDIGRAMGKFNLKDIFTFPSLATIAAAFSGLDEAIENAIGSIDINWPDPPSWVHKLPLLASGGIVSGAQTVIVGEAGAEAVVPLNRPLNQVDPAVRWLSAIAQGMVPPTQMASGGVVDRPIDITIVTPTEDPRAVAVEAVNQLVAVGY